MTGRENDGQRVNCAGKTAGYSVGGGTEVAGSYSGRR